ncbi:cysteine-rich CWC family protein [Limnohabitans sp. TEGF004]|uniref:cysteine-rich CWC family protein n=1 Tax=Limnohabitans sp. TEGF004 TaxID=2986281 RepID=UPI002492075F|nr:cysteine-rich CWC family protein [Limnohabitans sp. TEGF004]
MPSQMPAPIDACACPLCGKPNQCAMEVAKISGQPVAKCWCVNVSFPPELLAKVPVASQRKACICQACATKDAHG